MRNRNRNREYRRQYYRDHYRDHYRDRYRHHGHGLWHGFSLLAIGCVLIAIGLSLGGRWNGIPWWPWAEGKTSRAETRTEASAEKNGTITADIKNIDIRLKASRLVIKSGSTGGYSAKGFANNSISVSSRADTLKIEETEWRHIFNFGSESSRPVLEIVLPEGSTLKSCRITIDAGSAQFESIASDDFEIDNGAGSIKGTAISAKDVTVKTGAGSIELAGCTFDESEVTTGAGRFLFDGTIGKRTEVSTGAGSVEMSIKGKKNDYRIDYSRGVGPVRIDGESFTGMGNGTAGNENAEQKIKLSSGVGSVKIDFIE